MPYIEYTPRRFSADSYEVIRQARTICESYRQQGYDLTLRQLHYQFVARDLYPNTERSYKRLGSIVNDARLAGMLDWDFIVDRTRNLRSLAHWDEPATLVRDASRQFRLERWATQPKRVEVWIEKDALVGVLQSACPALDVPYFSCRGYTSQSEMWAASQRLRGYVEAGQQVVILHLGDHDPSGVDMTRDILERLSMFMANDLDLVDTEDDAETCVYEMADRFTLERIALNMEQVEQYKPPPNPAKFTDSRAVDYVRRYGRSSWELDALDPATLTALIQEHVALHRDAELWDATSEAEESEREVLTAAAERWTEVKELLS